MAKSFTLGKDERLKSRKLIEEVFSKGQRFTVFPYRVFFIHTKSAQGLQAGFGVNAKLFKTAVARNRIKRLGRETYRVQKNDLKQMLKQRNQSMALFFVYTSKELPEFNLLSEKMNLILQKLMAMTNEKNTATH